MPSGCPDPVSCGYFPVAGVRTRRSQPKRYSSLAGGGLWEQVTHVLSWPGCIKGRALSGPQGRVASGTTRTSSEPRQCRNHDAAQWMGLSHYGPWDHSLCNSSNADSTRSCCSSAYQEGACLSSSADNSASTSAAISLSAASCNVYRSRLVYSLSPKAGLAFRGHFHRCKMRVRLKDSSLSGLICPSCWKRSGRIGGGCQQAIKADLRRA